MQIHKKHDSSLTVPHSFGRSRPTVTRVDPLPCIYTAIHTHVCLIQEQTLGISANRKSDSESLPGYFSPRTHTHPLILQPFTEPKQEPFPSLLQPQISTKRSPASSSPSHGAHEPGHLEQHHPAPNHVPARPPTHPPKDGHGPLCVHNAS